MMDIVDPCRGYLYRVNLFSIHGCDLSLYAISLLMHVWNKEMEKKASELEKSVLKNY